MAPKGERKGVIILAKLKVGLLGCGNITGVHSASWKVLCNGVDAELVAFADLVPEKRAAMAEKFPGARQYEKAMDLLESETLDIADVCLPTYLHAEHAVAAMNKGINVFMEKPVCLRRSEVKKLLDAERNNGVKAMVGQVVRFFDEYRYLEKAYKSGEFGKLKTLFLQRISGGGSPKKDAEPKNVSWFRMPEKSGTAILDFHIHDVDYIRSLLGEPKSVSVVSDCTKERQPTHVAAVYQYDGVLAFAEGGWGHAAGYGFVMAYRANFEDATIVYSSREKPSVTLYKDGAVTHPEIPAANQYSSADGSENIPGVGPYFEEIRYFFECVAEGKPVMEASLADALKTYELTMTELEMAYRQAGADFPIEHE